MNNKGFTLIELLAVIIILSGIGLLAIFGITSSLEKQEEKKEENLEAKARNAAKIYFSLNNETCVTIDDLIKYDYLDLDSDEKIEYKYVVFCDNGYNLKENCSCS